MPFTLAIIGRPNVGKSTLFNRLVGRRLALVDDAPGLTRDRREGEARLGDLEFRLIDTAGLDEAGPRSLEMRMRAHTERAVLGSHAVLFLIDARAGLTPLDRHFAGWLRKLGRPVIVVANKCESANAALAGIAEAHGLGFGEPVPISAEHGEGLADLHRALCGLAPSDAFIGEDVEGAETATQEDLSARPIRLVVVGRPNVGKSTLVNRLLGEERVLTGPEPGITRDAIEVPWSWRGRAFALIDTAGLRKKARIVERLEQLSTRDTLRTIRAAQVVILVLDAAVMLERQDLQIARLAAEEGRALVIAVNKWDLIDEPQKALRNLRDRIETSLPQVRGVPFVTIAALQGRKLDELMKAVVASHEIWNAELPTQKLNRWLEGAVEAHPPPMVGRHRPRLRFIRQTTTRPPTFAIFGTRLTRLPEDYSRYLANGIRDTFKLPGVVIRFALRLSKNPYHES